MIESKLFDVKSVYGLCKKYCEESNITLRFPQNTPLQLTYQWRFLESITKKFIIWNFTSDEAELFVRIAMRKLRSTEHQNKGLNVLNDVDIIDCCYKEVKSTESNENQTTRMFQMMHKWLNKQSNGGDITNFLLIKRKPGSFTNITTYYESGLLVKLYLAFSKPCCIALDKLDSISPSERNVCPSQSSLYYTRRYQNKLIIPQIKEILGSDFHV